MNVVIRYKIRQRVFPLTTFLVLGDTRQPFTHQLKLRSLISCWDRSLVRVFEFLYDHFGDGTIGSARTDNLLAVASKEGIICIVINTSNF
jgi:hypothetical protein